MDSRLSGRWFGSVSHLYSHVAGKQELLVEVIDLGAGYFQAAAVASLGTEGTAADRLEALISGHVGVVLDHRNEVRTYLNEAAALDPEDTPDEHLEDTLVAGVGLCDVDAVRALVTEGPERVRELGQRVDEYHESGEKALLIE